MVHREQKTLKGKKQAQDGGDGSGPARRRFLRAGLLIALGLLCLLLVGPLRGVLSGYEPLYVAAAFVLFLIPGGALSGLLLGQNMRGAARVPVAFAFSAGAYGLAGMPALLLHWSLGAYLWIAGGVLAVSLLLAFLPARAASDEAPEEDRSLPPMLLWGTFAALAGVLAYATARWSYAPSQDLWLYLAYVRDFVDRGDNLGVYVPYSGGEYATFSRLVLNGWLLIQAGLSAVSGVDPVVVVQRYLAPALVIISLLAFYFLARVLFKSRGAALLSGCFYALFLLVYLDSSLQSPGTEFVGRIAEDKFVARFVFLPVALSVAVLFLRRREPRYLLAFGFLCWGVATVHPMGLVFIGISLAGLGLLHVAVDWRDRRAWFGTAALTVALLSIVLPPEAYLLLKTGSPLPSALKTAEPTRAAFQTQGAENAGRLLSLGPDSYIMHPSLLLEPVILGAYLLGVPFLILRLKASVAARLLLGVLLIEPVLLFIPPIATLLGGFTGPVHLWRLAWPLPLAAVLTLGWVAWTVVDYGRRHLDAPGRARSLAANALPLALLLILVAAAAPRAVQGVETADGLAEVAQDRTDCLDPAFARLREVATEKSVVLAPDIENSCIPAHAAYAGVVSLRSTSLFKDQNTPGGEQAKLPQNVTDAKAFFSGSTLDWQMAAIVHRQKVDYVLLDANDPVNAQLRHLSGFSQIDTTSQRYRLYGVDLAELRGTETMKSNFLLNTRNLEDAIASYNVLLAQETDEDERFLALLGLGQAYIKKARFEEAAGSLEAAIELAPEDPTPYPLLARAYAGAKYAGGAVQAREKAVDLEPENVRARLDLGKLLLKLGEEERAVEEYRAIVEEHPAVPDYRVQLGEALGRAGDSEEAKREFDEAISLSPLSERLHKSVAKAQKAIDKQEQIGEPREKG